MTASTKERILHALMIVGLICLTLSVILLNSIFSGANYSPAVMQNEVLPEDSGSENAALVEEHKDAYYAMKIHFLGSCVIGSMLGSDGYGTFNAMAAETEPDYFLKNTERLFRHDDWTIGLLGAVLSDNEELEPVNNSIRQERYKGTTSQAEILTAGGVDVVSLATLHTNDYGKEGYNDTVEAVETAGLRWGDDEHAVYLEKADVRLGIYLCSVNTLGANGTDRIINWVSSASEKCDMVMVYFSDRGVEVESEWWIPLGQACIDAGASVVLCNREIGPGSVEYYKDGVIIDSLGTFLNGGERYGEKENFVYAVTVYLQDGVVSGWTGELLPFHNYDEPWQPIPLSE